MCRAYAQTYDTLPYTVLHYTDENGLPQNSVKAIMRDRYGFIWMGTEGGVVRFDGKNFDVYNKSNTYISSSRILGLSAGGSTDEMYAVNDRHELLKIKGGSPTYTMGRLPAAYRAIAPTFSIDTCRLVLGGPAKLAEPANHWVYLYLKDDRSFYVRRPGRLAYYTGDKEIFSVPFDEKKLWTFFMVGGHFYAHSQEGGFFQLYDTAFRPFRLQGMHAGVTPGKFIYWDNMSGRAYQAAGDRLYELVRQKDGTLHASLLLEGFDPVQHNVCAVYHDPKNGNVFLGSSTEGFFFFKKHGFKVLKTGRGDGADVFYAHQYFGDGMAVTPGGYMLGPYRKAFQEKKLSKMSSDNYSLAISARPDGHMWFRCETLLIELDRKFNILRSWTFPHTLLVVYESNDALWIGLRKKGVYRLDLDKPGANPQLVLNVRRPSYFLQVDPEHMWLAGEKGLYRLRLHDRHVDTIPELEGVYVRSLYGKTPDEIWGTTNDDGFFLIKNGRFVRFPMDRNNYLVSAHCILEDKKRQFWIPTNKGLFVASKKDLLDYADGKNSGVYYFYYGKESGFATNEFNGGCQPCGVEWPDGHFSFPSLNGLVWFDPNTMEPEFPDEEIFFHRIEMDDRAIEVGDTVTTTTDFQRVTFFLTTPHLGNVNNLYMEATLLGSAQKNYWTRLGAENAISFTTLPPGTYTLVVRKAKGFGINNYSYGTIVIVVPTPVWQTWWFRTAATLLLLLAVYLLIQYRLRYIKQKNLALEKTVAQRTADLSETISALRRSEEMLSRKTRLQQKLILAFSHDLKSPLMYLMITGQKLYERLKGTPDKVTDGVRVMYFSAFNMYHFTDNFLNYAKAYFLQEDTVRETFLLNTLFNEKIDIFKYIAESKNIAIHNLLTADVQVHTNRMLLSVIIHNLLDNAIKYTDEGHVTLSVKTSATHTQISVADTGMGMDETTKRQYADLFGIPAREAYENDGAGKGLGLQIVKELVHILKGELVIDSTEGQGTVVSIVLEC